MLDAIIVGAGPSAAAAALAIRGKSILMLDVGNEPSAEEPLSGGLYEMKRSSSPCRSELLGDRFESLHNITNPYLMPKLKAPRMRYVIRDGIELNPIVSNSFFAVSSFAKGGLANVWGAQVYRFTERELAGFSVSRAELDPYYDRLERHIGVSGCNDDLVDHFSPSSFLQTPVALSPLAGDLLRIYAAHRKRFQLRGFAMGRPRLAVLTDDFPGRPAYSGDSLEFFQPHNRAIYNPAFTIDELIRAEAVRYEPRSYVRSFAADENGVEVHVERLDTGLLETLRAKRVFLAAGPLNTSRIVLESRKDFSTKLPLLDNLISYVPLLSLKHIGTPNSTDGLSIQLSLVYDGPLFEEPIMCTIYKTSGVLRSDLIMDFPLSIRGNLAAARYLLPALAVVQLWYPDRPNPENTVRLTEDRKLEVTYAEKPRGAIEQQIVELFRRHGYLGHLKLCSYPSPGNSFHYAGTLPMTNELGSPFTTRPDGRLGGERNVFVVDASVFPRLPSKNLTFTVMANAMRIAEAATRELES